MPESTLNLLLWLIPVPPLLAFVSIVLFTNRSNRISHWVALTGAGLSFVGSMVIFFKALAAEKLAVNPFGSAINWLPLGETWLKLGVQVDPLSAVMLFFVAWTVLMIFIYSIGYHNFGAPKGKHDRPGLPPEGAEVNEHGKVEHVASIEPMYARFFALISLFAFAMYLLVVSDNLLMLYTVGRSWPVLLLAHRLLVRQRFRPQGCDQSLPHHPHRRYVHLLGLAILYTSTGSLSFQQRSTILKFLRCFLLPFHPFWVFPGPG